MDNLSFDEYRALVSGIDLKKNCPVQAMIKLLSGKWNMQVLFELTKADSIRFGKLKEQIGGITNTMLSATLKELEESGLLVRTQFNEIPPHVEYSLSDKGRRLYPIFLAMAGWANENIT